MGNVKLPKISIIVSVYGIEKYIGKCLQSVCGQTYQNLEIIAVDDCSPDRSGNICDEYALTQERLTVIHHEKNYGPSAARNSGMAHATGAYYLFVDGDDWIDEKLCERAVECLQQSEKEIDTIHWGYQCMSEDGKAVSDPVMPVLYPEKVIRQPEIFDKFLNTLVVSLDDLYTWFESGKSYYETVHSKKQMASVWRYLLSAKVIEENHLQFPTHIERGEDIVFLFCYLLRCSGIGILSGQSYYYLQRAGSLMKEEVTIAKKIALIEAMEETVMFAPKEKRDGLRDKWRGQRILVVMNTARKLVKTGTFLKGYLDFRQFALHPVNREAVSRIQLKAAPFKYRVAIGLLKFKMYFLFFFCIFLLDRLHLDMAPME